jgi:hypothetical protein
MVSFGGQYTRSEWLGGLSLAMRPSKRDLALRLVAVAIFLVAAGLVVAQLLQGEQANVSRLVRTGLSGVLLLAWAILPFVRLRWTAGRAWNASGGQVSLKGTATNEGIATNAAPKLESWDSFLKAVRRDDMVVLIGNDGLATVLPKRFFENDRAWQEFVQLVDFKVVSPRQ